MEQSAEVFEPSRLCLRIGWAVLACCLLCGLAGWQYPIAFLPSGLFAIAAGSLFWMGSRPEVRVLPTQFNVGERAISWREVREINTTLARPLVARINLTNCRHKLLVFPAASERAAQLMYQLRRHSYLATFDGVAYRDFWTWSTLHEKLRDRPVLQQPVRMLSAEDEDEVERLFQKLKTVGRLDAHVDDSAGGRS